VTALAALDPTERERVEEAAAEAEMHPAVWLAETAAEVVEEGGPVAGPESLAEQVERTIFKRTPV
jgi:hypothetical protein